MNQLTVEKRTVWISEEEQAASFHPVDGYQQKDFWCLDYYISYLHSLTQRGFRFQ